MSPQFSDFRNMRNRIRRTLNYGSKQPHTLNFPLSELVVDYFDKNCPFDYMKPETSTSISRGYADPCALVIAMVYLDRLRVRNKEFFDASDPTELYLPALVLASKFLHDSDTCDSARNSHWVESANISSGYLNNLEWKFIKELDWDIMVHETEFNNWLSMFEYWVASDFVSKNGFCTYNEIHQLSSAIPSSNYFSTLHSLLSVFSLATLVYTLTVVSLLWFPAKLHDLQSSGENSTMPSIISVPSTSFSLSPFSVLSPISDLDESKCLSFVSIPLFVSVKSVSCEMRCGCCSDFENSGIILNPYGVMFQSSNLSY